MTAVGIRYTRDLPAIGTPSPDLAALADHETSFGARLGKVAGLAAAFRAGFAGTGTPDRVSTHDLITLPYPTRFALWRSATTLAPFVSITNRMLIVAWTEPAGGSRVLVRRWLGTTAPQSDLSADEPLVAAFPNAKLIVQRRELDAMADLHPLQKPWYQAEIYRDLPRSRSGPLTATRCSAPAWLCSQPLVT